LKKELAKQFKKNREAYTEGKTEFVKHVLELVQQEMNDFYESECKHFVPRKE